MIMRGQAVPTELGERLGCAALLTSTRYIQRLPLSQTNYQHDWTWLDLTWGGDRIGFGWERGEEGWKDGGKRNWKFKYRRSKKTGADPVATFLSLLLKLFIIIWRDKWPKGKGESCIIYTDFILQTLFDVISYFLCLANLLFYDVNSCQFLLSFWLFFCFLNSNIYLSLSFLRSYFIYNYMISFIHLLSVLYAFFAGCPKT